MLSNFPLVLGLMAGCVSTYAFLPQVLKIWRERDCEAISVRMYALRQVGFVLWLAYGVLLGSIPLVVFNLLNMLLGGAILVFKLQALGLCPDPKGRFRRESRATA